MTKKVKKLLLLLTYIVSICFLRSQLSTRVLVESYSWGAGSCASGGAIGGYHLESYEGDQDNVTTLPEYGGIRCIRSGTLVKAGIHVTIGNHSITSNSKPLESLQYDVEYQLQIFMLKSIFRGVLIRLSSLDNNTTDLTDALYTTDPLLQMATTACTDPTVAVGVTHRSSIDKDLVYATLRFDSSEISATPGQSSVYGLEITVVGMNNELGSLYAYSSFKLQVSDQVPTTADDQTSGNSLNEHFDGDEDIFFVDPSDEDVTSATSRAENDNELAAEGNIQSTTLVVGFTALGGAFIAGIFIILYRSKVRQLQGLNIQY